MTRGRAVDAAAPMMESDASRSSAGAGTSAGPVIDWRSAACSRDSHQTRGRERWPQRSFTIGIEEEYQIIHPETRELTSYIQEFLDAGPGGPQGSDQAGVPPVPGRGRQPHLRRHPRKPAARARPAAPRGLRAWPRRRGLRVAAAGTHPFTSWTDAAGDRRPASATPSTKLRTWRRRRPADAGLRHARAHRHRGPRAPHRRHEPGALLHAALAGAFHQLTLLARARDGSQVLPHDRPGESAAVGHGRPPSARGPSTSASSTR